MHTIDTSPVAQASTFGFRRWALCVAAGGVALAALAWSSPGLAAAHTSPGCDRVAHDLQNLDIDPLAVELADLSDVAESAEASDELTDSVAPLLFLTPRVATILEDVFGDSDEVTAEAATAASPKAAKPKPATSPVVDNAGGPDMDAPVSSMYENAAILPRFQRQMYRTDI